MNMSRFIRLSFSVAVVLVVSTISIAAPEKSAEGPEKYLLECSIFQINASISGDTSLTDDIGMYDEEGRPNATVDSYTFFTLADLTIGGASYRFDADGATLEKKSSPDNQSRVNAVACPTVLTLAGQFADMKMGGNEVFQYMQPTDDGRYELKLLEVPVGFSIRYKVQPGEDGRIKLDPFVISISAVKEREPIEGVKLNVGKPMVSKVTSELSLTFQSGRAYGVMWRTKDQGVLLISLKVSEVKPEDPE